MLVTVTINLWWLVGLLALAYIVISVLGVRQASGMVTSEIRLYRRYGKRYTLARYLTRACGRSYRWLFLPAHLLTYGLGWQAARRSAAHSQRDEA